MAISLFDIKNKLTPIVWLTVALLAVLPPGQRALDVVLCIGQGRHVALEVASNLKCGSPGEEEAAELALIAGHSLAPTHCGTCTDIPLPILRASYVVDHQPVVKNSVSTFTAYPAQTLVENNVQGHRRFFETEVVESPNLTPLRSIVLLI